MTPCAGCNTLSADADQLSECSVPGFRQNRQVRIQNLAELHATGFLAGIVGTCGASGVHQENGGLVVQPCSRKDSDMVTSSAG